MVQIFGFALQIYQVVHDEPASQHQIVQIFDNTNTVINQTVINLPPGQR